MSEILFSFCLKNHQIMSNVLSSTHCFSKILPRTGVSDTTYSSKMPVLCFIPFACWFLIWHLNIVCSFDFLLVTEIGPNWVWEGQKFCFYKVVSGCNLHLCLDLFVLPSMTLLHLFPSALQEGLLEETAKSELQIFASNSTKGNKY